MQDLKTGRTNSSCNHNKGKGALVEQVKRIGILGNMLTVSIKYDSENLRFQDVFGETLLELALERQNHGSSSCLNLSMSIMQRNEG